MRHSLLLLFLVLLGCTADGKKLSEAKPTAEAAPFEAKGRYADRPKLILDADTANEIDDLYTIARLLAEDSVDVLGLTSAQWFHVWSGDSTVYQSQQLNEEILSIARRSELPHPLGADLMMGKPWGDYDPRPSAASQFIIDQVKALPPGEKLVVMSIGAATNLASAIAIDSSIAPQVVAYTLGFQYDFAGGFWNKDEFNIRRDLNAANFLLNQADLELHIMPISVAKLFEWPRKTTFDRLQPMGEMGQYLRNRWATYSPEAESWIMWDVALLEAFLHPTWTNEVAVLTPPENTQRYVWMYQSLATNKLEADFWQAMRKHYQ